MSDKKDPLNDFFSSVVNDYKEGFKSAVNSYKTDEKHIVKVNNNNEIKNDEEYQFPYHSDLIKKSWRYLKLDFEKLKKSCKKCYVGKDLKKTLESIKDYKNNLFYIFLNSIPVLIPTATAFYFIRDYKVLLGGLIAGALIKQTLQAVFKGKADLIEVRKVQDRLIPYFKEDIIVNSVVYADKKEKGTITVKSRLPFPLINRNNLEHALNYSITDIVQDKKNLHKLAITIVKGKSRDYVREEKGSLERLEAILRYYKDNPKYVETVEHESDTQHVFISRLGQKKLNRIISEFPSRLGIKQEDLTLEFEEDKVIFSIKQISTAKYMIDTYIRDVKRPNNYKIPFIFGINRKTSKPLVFDYESIQHMLVGGMTGSGKSSVVHGFLYSLMYWNDDIFFYMIDLKGTELPFVYSKFSNCSVVGIEDYETEDESISAVVNLVNEVYEEYRKRVKLFKEIGCKDLKGYNTKVNQRLPIIIFLIDEVNYLFEVMQKRNKKAFDDIESCISTLLSRGRSTGIYSIHTMQNITDKIYNINWRRSMMTRLCMKMAELRQCQMIIENDLPLADKAYKQSKGEYIVVKDSVSYELQNLRVNDELEDKTYINLKEKFSIKENGGLENVKDFEEIEEKKEQAN